MQKHPLLNEAAYREDVLESGGVAPSVLILGYRWSWVVSFTFRQLWPRGKTL